MAFKDEFFKAKPPTTTPAQTVATQPSQVTATQPAPTAAQTIEEDGIANSFGQEFFRPKFAPESRKYEEFIPEYPGQLPKSKQPRFAYADRVGDPSKKEGALRSFAEGFMGLRIQADTDRAYWDLMMDPDNEEKQKLAKERLAYQRWRIDLMPQTENLINNSLRGVGGVLAFGAEGAKKGIPAAGLAGLVGAVAPALAPKAMKAAYAAASGEEMAKIEGGSAYRQYTEAGIPGDVAKPFAIATGVVNAVLETAIIGQAVEGAVGAAGAVAKAAAKKAVRNRVLQIVTTLIQERGLDMVKQIAAETAEEMAQQAVTDVMQTLAAQEAGTPEKGLSGQQIAANIGESGKQALGTMTALTLLTGGLGGIAGGMAPAQQQQGSAAQAQAPAAPAQPVMPPTAAQAATPPAVPVAPVAPAQQQTPPAAQQATPAVPATPPVPQAAPVMPGTPAAPVKVEEPSPQEVTTQPAAESKKIKPIRVTDKSAADNPQQVIISDGKIRVISKIGRSKVGEYTFDISEWEEADKPNAVSANPNWNKRKLIEAKFKAAFPQNYKDDIQTPFLDRVIDSEIRGIEKAYKAYNAQTPAQPQTPSQEETKQPPVTSPATQATPPATPPVQATPAADDDADIPSIVDVDADTPELPQAAEDEAKEAADLTKPLANVPDDIKPGQRFNTKIYGQVQVIAVDRGTVMLQNEHGTEFKVGEKAFRKMIVAGDAGTQAAEQSAEEKAEGTKITEPPATDISSKKEEIGEEKRIIEAEEKSTAEEKGGGANERTQSSDAGADSTADAEASQTESVEPVRADGEGALEGTPSEDVSGTSGKRETERSTPVRAGTDKGRTRATADAGTGVRPSVGDSEGEISTPADRSGLAEPVSEEAEKPTKTEKKAPEEKKQEEVSEKKPAAKPEKKPETKMTEPEETEKADAEPSDIEEEVKEIVRKVTANPKGQNFVITDDLELGGDKTRFQNNIAAIKLSRQIETENRPATPAEQEVLIKYVGWGGLANAFKADYRGNPAAGWEKEYHELKDLLTKEEWDAARQSTQNAHYTSISVIQAIYGGLRAMGFNGGRILEPSSGIGHFIGAMPADLAKKVVSSTAVELDPLTGRICKALYPQTNVKIQGYEETNLADNFYDLVISNVPFGNYQVIDNKYPKFVTSAIHNYFFAKSLDKVRPGGVVAFITSHFTLDAKNGVRMREYFAEKADFMGAVRLPRTAFKSNAKTEVVTDIIFLRKRAKNAPYAGEQFKVTIPEKVGEYYTPINEYFIDNPEMVLGAHAMSGSMYGSNEYTVEPNDKPLAPEIEAAIKKISKKYKMEYPVRTKSEVAVEREIIPAPDTVKQGAYAYRNGKLYVKDGENLVEYVPPNQKAGERIKGLMEIRDAVRVLQRAQIENKSEKEIADARKKLNQVYDKFVKSYGNIHSRGNSIAFGDDPDFYLLLSIENYDEVTQKATKADIFTKNTITPREKITSAGTGQEALVISLNETGTVDMPRMQELTGKTEAELVAELSGRIFKAVDGTYETAEQYLSGNVRAKLKDARAMAETDKSYQANVDALEAVQPKDLTASQIYARIGSPWVPKEAYAGFLGHILNQRSDNFEVTFINTTGQWVVENTSSKDFFAQRRSAEASKVWGTNRMDAFTIIERTMNNKQITVYDKLPDDKIVVNQKETLAAREKQEKLQEEFARWLWEDAGRQTSIVSLYNETYNNINLPTYDGSHLTTPGINPHKQLRPHQKDAVWRIISSGGNTLLAHAVGAGKSGEMIAAAMELRRMGIVKKPLFVVPNHLVSQWGEEFLSFYPGANILVATKKDFAKGRRKVFMNRIANGDYDAIIIAESQFGKLPMSIKAVEQFYQEQIDELERQMLESAAEEEGSYFRRRSSRRKDNVKNIAKAIEVLKGRMKKKIAGMRKDTENVNFEELGIDALFVDEAHKFKNLMFGSNLTRVTGLGNRDGSNKAFDMYMKVQYLQKLNGGRGVVFATATPVMNSMSEMYTMQRYLQPDALKQRNLTSFDAWANTFGKITTVLEMKPDGSGYRQVNAFSSFINLGDLVQMFRSFADVKTKIAGLKLPKVKGGSRQAVVAEPSQALLDFIQTLVKRAEKIASGHVKPEDDNMLVVVSDGRKAALDMRLVSPSLPDDPKSKVNMAVDNIHAIWKRTAKDKLTQLVFLDLSTPKTEKDSAADTDTDDAVDADAVKANISVYEDMRKKLIRSGIPANEIAFIHEANTDAKKLELFKNVNTGKVRVLFGSTEKMGVGMNVQKKLIALHHLDQPWRPGDIEQREGRIIRQGNENEEVEIYAYITERSLDARMWDTLERKAAFIYQAMESGVDIREVQDIGADVVSFAELKAIASGNPLMQEQVVVEAQVRKYSTLKTAYDEQQRRTRREIAALKGDIEYDQTIIEKMAIDLENRQDISGDRFKITIRGKQYTERKDAGAALNEFYAKNRNNIDKEIPMEVGSFAGFKVFLKQNGDILIRGEHTYHANLEETELGTIASMQHAVSRIPQNIKGLRDGVKEGEEKITKLKKTLETPFEHTEKLEKAIKRQQEIMLELNPPEEVTAAGVAAEAGGADTQEASDVEAAAATEEEAGETYYIYKSGAYQEVKGEPITIEEAPDFEFFIHKTDNNAWRVAEAKTGLALGDASNIKKTAIANAREKAIAHKNELPGIIERSIKRNGASPRYAQQQGGDAAEVDRLPRGTYYEEAEAADNISFATEKELRRRSTRGRMDSEIDRLPSRKGMPAMPEKAPFTPPKKTIKAYKLLRVKNGKLYPLFVGADKETLIGQWLVAEEGPAMINTKTGRQQVKSKLGGLAYRPGWHLGDIPLATHIGKKGADGTIEAMKPDTVWCECEVAADIDYQPEANKNGINPKTGKLNRALADIKRIPEGGFYRYKTNPNMTGEWIITGAMRINRVLSDNEVAQIVRKAGFEPQPREGKNPITGDAVLGADEAAASKADEIDRLTSTSTGPSLRPASGTYRGSPDRVKRASEIAKSMQIKLLLAIKKGGTQGNVGTFNRRTWVIRLTKANDLPALSHETGHGFDKMYDMSNPRTATNRGYNGAAIDTELLTLGKATSRPNYSNKKIRREGVAEYTRLYLTDRNEALRRAPEFTGYFEAMIPGKVRSIIQQISDDIAKLTDMDPVERVKKSIHFKGDPFQKEPLDVMRTLRRIYTGVFDATFPVEWAAGQLGGKAAQKKVANMQAAFRGYEGIALNDVNPERDPNLKQVDLSGKEIGETFSTIMGDIMTSEAKRQDFTAYMVARRAADYDARGLEMPDDPRTYRAAVKKLESKYPEFRKTFDAYLEFDRKNAHLLVEGGIYSEEKLDEIIAANPNHVSLRRIKEAFDYVAGTGKRLSGAKKVIKKLKGGGEDIQDPMENTINNVFIYRSVAMRNRILQQLADMADREEGKGWVMEKAPQKFQVQQVNLEKVKKALEDAGVDTQGINLDIMATIFNPNNLAGPNQVVVYREGKPIIYDVHPDLYDAIAGMQPEAANQVVQIAAALARLQKSGILGAPQYMYRNLTRDTFQNIIASRADKGVMNFIFGLSPFDIIGGFVSTFRKDAWYRKAQQGGGTQNFFTSADRAYSQEALDKMVANRSRAKLVINKLREAPRYFKAHNYTEGFTALLDGISYAYGILRDKVEPLELGGRMAEFKKLLIQMGNKPEDVEEAVHAMRDISIDFKRMGAWVKRFQANRFINFFNSQLQGMDKFGRMFKENPVRTALRSMIYITLPSLALLAVNGDNPWYHELPWYRKDFFWNVPVGDPRSTKVFIPVPKPWEIGIIFGSIPERLITSRIMKDGAAWTDFKKNMAQTFLPDIMPSALAPIYENAVNRDWRGIPIVNEGDKRVSPYLQYNERTSEIAKALGGAVNLSPKQIDHVITGYTGTLGTIGLKLADAAAGKQIEGGALGAVSTGFVTNATWSPQSVDDFYRLKQEADQLKADMKRRDKTVPYRLNEIISEFTRVSKEISELRDQINDYRRRGLTRLADATTQQMIVKAQRASRLYETYKKATKQ